MRVLRRVVVFDAADIEAESGFWAGLGGTVHRDENWHSVLVDTLELGGRLLQAPPADDPDGGELFAVWAGPTGHPFCLGVH